MNGFIHPDAKYPNSDFDGWLEELVGEATEAGADHAEMAESLRKQAEMLEEV